MKNQEIEIAKTFWRNFDKANSRPLNSLCQELGIKYNTIRSYRNEGRLPGLYEAFLLTEHIGTTVENCLKGDSPAPIVNENYERALLDNIRENAPQLFEYIIATFGYSGSMAEQIKSGSETTRA